MALTLPAGTYLLEVFVRFSANGANSRISVSSTSSPTWTGYRGTCANGASPVRVYGAATGAGGTPWANTTNVDNHERGGVMIIAAEATVTIWGAQSTASGTTTTVAAGSYFIARRIA
jgi:hypothetical protein